MWPAEFAFATLPVSRYSLTLLRCYLSKRTLVYETSNVIDGYSLMATICAESTPVEAYVRSSIGGASIVGFADDFDFVVVIKHIRKVKDTANRTVTNVKAGLEATVLHLADRKTDVMHINRN